MPRKQRIEYAGAMYHVISRGNYRKDLFDDEKTSGAFEKCLFETVERCGWKLYAYVIMRNHYHLVVETVEPNLVVGMKWLQGVFATRFNRFRNERGHVFQGRYKAILIGNYAAMQSVVDYVHLNPARAGICKVNALKSYKSSSYPKYFRKHVQSGLYRECFLRVLGLPDSLAGIRRYAKHLELREEGNPRKREELSKSFCRGWFLGDKTEKKALLEDLNTKHPDIVWEGTDLRDLNENRWQSELERLLTELNKSPSDIQNEAKGASWKAQIASKLKTYTTANNKWIATHLNMGHTSRVSNLIREYLDKV